MTYTAGYHRFICDVCGFEFLSDKKRRRWDGLIVCPADYENDHPQKHLRVQPDGQAVKDPRPEPADVFVVGSYCNILTRSPMANVGVADCMTVGAVASIHYPDHGYPAPNYNSAIYDPEVYESGVYA